MAARAQQQRNMQSATDQGEASPSQPTIPCVAGDGGVCMGVAGGDGDDMDVDPGGGSVPAASGCSGGANFVVSARS